MMLIDEQKLLNHLENIKKFYDPEKKYEHDEIFKDKETLRKMRRMALNVITSIQHDIKQKRFLNEENK